MEQAFGGHVGAGSHAELHHAYGQSSSQSTLSLFCVRAYRRHLARPHAPKEEDAPDFDGVIFDHIRRSEDIALEGGTNTCKCTGFRCTVRHLPTS